MGGGTSSGIANYYHHWSNHVYHLHVHVHEQGAHLPTPLEDQIIIDVIEIIQSCLNMYDLWRPLTWIRTLTYMQGQEAHG